MKHVVYDFLAKRGIALSDVAGRFPDVEDSLGRLFGDAGRAVLVGTLAKICEEYSIPLNLEYAESASGRLEQVMEYISIQRFAPKHFRKDLETRNFEDKAGEYAPWSD